ncbi:hypothetical protein ACHAW6_012383 [Cyclotella cf. meneghiniana]
MDKFLANLTGNKADDKNSKKKDASWQGGRSDMDSIKNNNSDNKNNNNNSNNAVNNNNGPKNLLANANSALQKIDLFKSSKAPSTKGGQSLGGTKPGRLLPVSLPHPGPLGLEIEKRRDAAQSAIISSVVPNSQADVAGLLRGDVICRSDDRDFSYHEFLKLAQSGQRPLRFQVRRVESSSSSSLLREGNGSVDALHRKQAVIAAAEAREAKNKALWNKSSSSTKETDRGKPPPTRTDANADVDASSESPPCDNAETLRAIEAIKAAEKNDAETLGYNPYEARAMTSGQARNATVVMTRGEMNADKAPVKLRGEGTAAPGAVRAPRDLTAIVVPVEFENAFSVLVTSCPDGGAVRRSLATMRKLIYNAVTKGQRGLKDDKEEETAAKFRRVRLSNPKIKEAVTDMHGALEVMMAVGFVLSENEADGETYLVFPPGEEVADWIEVALRQMEEYELALNVEYDYFKRTVSANRLTNDRSRMVIKHESMWIELTVEGCLLYLMNEQMSSKWVDVSKD